MMVARHLARRAAKELRKEDLTGVAGGFLNGAQVIGSAAEEKSAMERASADMGGLGGYGNRDKR